MGDINIKAPRYELIEKYGLPVAYDSASDYFFVNTTAMTVEVALRKAEGLDKFSGKRKVAP